MTTNENINKTVPINMDAINSFKQLMQEYELSKDIATQLLSVLTRIRVVMLVDDSSSMLSNVNEPIPGQRLVFNRWTNTFNPLQTRPSSQTRWGEAQQAAAALCRLVTTVSPELLHPQYRVKTFLENNSENLDRLTQQPYLGKHGLDVWFLNRNGLSSVTQLTDLANHFSVLPRGSTPLIKSVKNIIKTYTPLCEQGCHVLLLILGDGEPSDGDTWSIQNTFSKKNDNFHISFVECNDNEEEMAWMDSLDSKIQNFHNLDDFRLETMRVAYYQGSTVKYTYNDYIISAVLSTFVPQYFLLDQVRSTRIKMTTLPKLPVKTPKPFEWLDSIEVINNYNNIQAYNYNDIKKYGLPPASKIYSRNRQGVNCVLL